MTNSPLAIIILAAGKGTRMHSSLPKVLHKINDKPMIVHVIDTAIQLNPTKIIAVLGYRYKMVQESIKEKTIEYAIQKKQLGTAHAVLQCHKLLNDFNGNILVLYGDVPLINKNILTKLINKHIKKNALCTVLTTDINNPKGYGRIIRNNDLNLIKIVEEKDANDKERNIKEINTGFYIFNAKNLFKLLPLVNNHNKQNEYYLPDVINIIIKQKGKVAINKIKNNFEIQGVNNIEQLNKLNDSF